VRRGGGEPRQLDGEREPVEPAADLDDRRRVVVGDREVGPHCTRRSTNSSIDSIPTSAADTRWRVSGGRPSGGTGDVLDPTRSGSRLVTRA
jgi:hypothetical protein